MRFPRHPRCSKACAQWTGARFPRLLLEPGGSHPPVPLRFRRLRGVELQTSFGARGGDCRSGAPSLPPPVASARRRRAFSAPPPRTRGFSSPRSAPLPPPPRRRASNFVWCSGGDSNPHGLPHMALNHARLPVPPPERSSLVFHPCLGGKGVYFTIPPGICNPLWGK